jgi:acetylornithine/N-succinyldiaminopimelate aminotransferase
MLHSSNLYRIPQQEQLADKLAALSGMDEVFFCNSGCEANEAAIKLARYYGHRQGMSSGRRSIVMENAFHGRTMATLSATGNRKAQAGFEPLVSGFVRVPLQRPRSDSGGGPRQPERRRGDARNRPGRGWYHIADVDFQRGLRALCATNGWLLICDEVQCGTGRTGTWFGFQHAGIRPDVVTLAKGLGGGVPIGACLAGLGEGPVQAGQAWVDFRRQPAGVDRGADDHRGHRRGWLDRHAVPCRRLIREGLAQALADCRRRGRDSRPGPDDRHRTRSPCGELVTPRARGGLLINVTADKVVRLLPPLTFSADEARELVTRLAD